MQSCYEIGGEVIFEWRLMMESGCHNDSHSWPEPTRDATKVMAVGGWGVQRSVPRSDGAKIVNKSIIKTTYTNTEIIILVLYFDHQ